MAHLHLWQCQGHTLQQTVGDHVPCLYDVGRWPKHLNTCSDWSYGMYDWWFSCHHRHNTKSSWQAIQQGKQSHEQPIATRTPNNLDQSSDNWKQHCRQANEDNIGYYFLSGACNEFHRHGQDLVIHLFSNQHTRSFFLLKAQTMIDPLYGMKMPWQCGHERLIICTHYYFYSCISLSVVLLEVRSIKTISFATWSILIGHSIGRLAPLWLSKDTTRGPTQGH
jgi:hypothetical protein